MENNLQFFYQKTATATGRVGHFFFIAGPFFILLLVLITGFFQQPAADDFGVFNLTVKYGLWGSIKFYFENGDSRYFSMPVLFLITSSRFLLTHYFLVIAGLFILNWLVLYYFIKELMRFFLLQPGVKTLCWLTALLLLVFISSLMQLSSFLYWWSAAFTYLVPFDVFLLYFLFFLKFISSADQKENRFFFIILLLLAFLACGSNEEVAYFTIVCSGLYFLFRFFTLKKIDKKLLLLLAAEFVFNLLLFFSPGNVKRAGEYSAHPQSMGYSMVSALYQSAEMFGLVISNPFFWMAFIALFLMFPHLKPVIREAVSAKRNFMAELAMLYLTVILFYFILRAFGGWVLHARANNAIILVVVAWLLLIAVRNGISNTRFIPNFFNPRIVEIAKWAFVFFLLFNSFTQSIVKSIWAGYYHSEVLHERVALIEKAKSGGRHSIEIPPYKQAIDSLLQHRYSLKWARFLQEKLTFPPSNIYFIDDPWFPECDAHYAEFYGIDTIITGKNRVVRFGLTQREK